MPSFFFVFSVLKLLTFVGRASACLLFTSADVARIKTRQAEARPTKSSVREVDTGNRQVYRFVYRRRKESRAREVSWKSTKRRFSTASAVRKRPRRWTPKREPTPWNRT